MVSTRKLVELERKREQLQFDYHSTRTIGRKIRNQVLTRLKASKTVPRTAIVRVNLRYGIALLMPKTFLQNLLRNSRLLSSELTIMRMPSTAGNVQISILMIRITKPIFKSGIKNYRTLMVMGRIHAIANLKKYFNC